MRGFARDAKQYANEQVAALARRMEQEYATAFSPFRATFRVTPIWISRVASVGAGLRLDLDPHDVRAWEHWGYFESDVEYQVRPRFSRRWRTTKSVAELDDWMKRELADYLETLERRTSSPGL